MRDILRLLTAGVIGTVVTVLSCSIDEYQDRRFPGSGEPAWDANLPPTVFWRSYAPMVLDNDNLQTAFELFDERGESVPFSLNVARDTAALCVSGGLNRGETYTWTFRPKNEYVHQAPVPENRTVGTWTFTTAEQSENAAPDRDCLRDRQIFLDGYGGDTGDTGGVQ
ncbi:MAG: hypothetical protein AAFV53_32295 [Myxococcota bacterium]